MNAVKYVDIFDYVMSDNACDGTLYIIGLILCILW